jgi:TolB-like protein
LAAVAAIVAIAVVSWLAWQRPATTESANGKASIAVLPFVDMTAEQDQRFLGHGIAEEILNFLAQSEDLRVIARTSSFAFEGTGADIETIGRKLSVTHILEGSVRHGGDQLRITTKLVNAHNNSPVWSRSYDRPTGNILGIESDIAHSVAEALHAQLDLQQTTTPGPNPYAHALIIEARSFNRLFGAGGHEFAERMLLEALEIDPDNVAALTELARSAFFGRGAEGSSGRDAAWQRSIALTNRALEIDPQDAVANAWRGYHEIHYFGDFAAGARYLERAMESDPAHSDVIGVVINACLFFGQYDLAIALGKFVMLRDPLCVSCAGSLATNAMLQGDFELAETTIRQPRGSQRQAQSR